MEIAGTKEHSKIASEILTYYEQTSAPWVIAYSGGKDSTMTVQIILETISRIQNHNKQVHIVYADTKVEPPPVIENATLFLRRIAKWAISNSLPVSTAVLAPPIHERFFVLMIGKGYLPPTRYFRWCTDRLKVRPIKRYVRALIQRYGASTVIVGMRKKESSSRDRRLKKKNYSKFMPFEGLKGATVYAPILELSIEDVWNYLLDSEPPWGMDNRFLRTLYTGGNASCSLFCGGIRFGCWVCTVVKQDRCTQGLAQLPGWEWLRELLRYRQLMLDIRNDPQNRILRSRNGREYLGPLTMRARQLLLAELKNLEIRLGRKLLCEQEERLIYLLWDKDRETSRNTRFPP